MIKLLATFVLGILIGQYTIILAYNPARLEKLSDNLAEYSFVFGCRIGANTLETRCKELGVIYRNNFLKKENK